MGSISRIDTLANINSEDTLRLSDAHTGNDYDVPVSVLLGGWRDLRTALVAAKVPAVGSPTLTAFGPSGGIFQNAFAVDDTVFFAFHIDHDVKQGSTMFPHVHWTTNGVNTATVKWEFEYTIAARNGSTIESVEFPAPSIITIEEAAAGTAWTHMVTEDATGFTAPEIDSLVVCKLKRITNGGTNNTDDVFGLFCDIHYECQQYGTPSRSPDYYTPD